MRILISNDDGYKAKGIKVLVKELEKIIDEDYKPAMKLPGQSPTSKLIPSYGPDGKRIDTGTKYGVSIYASNTGVQKVEKVEGAEANVDESKNTEAPETSIGGGRTRKRRRRKKKKTRRRKKKKTRKRRKRKRRKTRK